MGRLTQWLVTHHNDSIIRSISLSYGPNDDSYTRYYIQNKSNFIDFYLELNDAEVANSINQLDLDIIIDLTAHTYKGRMSIAALKPSSIVVNYLGFPGTTGCKGFDYNMVTSHIVPPELSKSLFSEKMIYLPYNYQVYIY
jgi:predicted O-linked N-acetylglucosamine transferase (SPINDLY family)